ncbi:uncharacterized protein DUF4920 [Flavobacteriaceae bacterium MAR_2010_72]|nr:uncharacterized protein DUF4920 [Flavobacteriaceae bacterium MAR_2010_72]TVZ60329.1 uncharacterized protein DUF4920 [Flavobacteriaceae bacterium MAR_2010_105]
MKLIFRLLIVALIAVSCKNETKQNAEVPVEDAVSYTSVGLAITDDQSLLTSKAAEQYKMMALGDTIPTKMTAKVVEVCQAKGCWMTLTLEDGNEVMVKFKDYGFFMPKDIAGKEVIVNGMAFVNEVPVDEQQHYAEDAGKSKEEIAAITTPKKTYSFEADGVLIKQ